VRDEDLGKVLVLGDDLGAWREHVAQFENAGFTQVAVHNVGIDQAGFIEFAKRLL